LSEEEFNSEDAVIELMEQTGKRSNISMFAFTATPKNKTLRLFGRPNSRGAYEAFHLYSMKQAIEEGFILDVLQNYIEYDTYFDIAQISEDDPVLKRGNAKSQIALFASLNEENISQKVQIIVEHFRTYVMDQLGGGAKAMVVTSSRAEAVRYRLAVDAYLKERGIKDVSALVAFSGSVKLDKDGLPTKNEGKEYSEIGMNGIPEKKLPAVFDGDEYNLLLVANKYQVGFDQPKLCAMYILKKLKDVNAVQTLSRLNRTCKPYDKNVIVLDFANTAADMEKAFSKYYTTTLD
jgi:type I restriction enzyme R subunit